MRRLTLLVALSVAACSGSVPDETVPVDTSHGDGGSSSDGGTSGGGDDAGKSGGDDAGVSSDSGSGDDGGASDPSTFITKRGSLIFSDDFSSGSLSPNWSIVGGTWSEANGLLTGSAPPTEHDPNVGHMSPGDRSVLQFTFRLDGNGEAGMRWNEKDPNVVTNSNHLVAVRVNTTTADLRQMSGWGSTTVSTTLDTATVNLTTGKFYTGVVEVLDRNVVFSIDGKKVLSGMTVDQSATPKNHFVLAAYNTSVSYDSVKLWAALPP